MGRATRSAHQFEVAGYLAAAAEFQAAAEESAARARWRAAGMAAIHAAIAAADAVCVFQVGERATSTTHEDAADLLEGCRAAGALEKAAQLRAVLELKNRVEYESRPVSETEARQLLKRSKRLVDWAGTAVK